MLPYDNKGKYYYPFLNKDRHIWQGFGNTPFAKTHRALYAAWGGIHAGVDLECQYGELVYPAFRGTVYVGKSAGNGNFVRVTSGKFMVEYFHLSKVLVKNGGQATVGVPLGKAGNTGAVFPPPTKSNPYEGTHLHWGFWYAGKPYNPLLYGTRIKAVN